MTKDCSSFFIYPGVLLTFYIVFTSFSLRRNIYLYEDAGRELNSAFRTYEGELPYRDFYWKWGPIGPLMGAGLFKLFGVHADVRFIEGIVIIGLISLFLYLILLHIMPPFLSFGAVLLYWATFGFFFASFYPYSFAATYTALGGMITLFFLLRTVTSQKTIYLVGASVGMGIALLGKHPPALVFLILAGGWLFLHFDQIRAKAKIKLFIYYFLPAFLIATGIYGYFAWWVGPKELIRQLTPFWVFHACLKLDWNAIHLIRWYFHTYSHNLSRIIYMGFLISILGLYVGTIFLSGFQALKKFRPFALRRLTPLENKIYLLHLANLSFFAFYSFSAFVFVLGGPFGIASLMAGLWTSRPRSVGQNSVGEGGTSPEGTGISFGTENSPKKIVWNLGVAGLAFYTLLGLAIETRIRTMTKETLQTSYATLHLSLFKHEQRYMGPLFGTLQKELRGETYFFTFGKFSLFPFLFGKRNPTPYEFMSRYFWTSQDDQRVIQALEQTRPKLILIPTYDLYSDRFGKDYGWETKKIIDRDYHPILKVENEGTLYLLGPAKKP